MYFANVTSYGLKARSGIFARTEPLVGVAETHLENADFAPLAGAHYRRWARCAVAKAIPTAKGGTQGGVLLTAARHARADPSAMCTFSASVGTHTSPHRDAVFFWASICGRRILVGAAYAREGNTLRVAHALSQLVHRRPDRV